VSYSAGTGPGEITDDGCAVEFYTLLPPFGEAEIVHAAVPAGASILELGCGTGRILKPLAELGHRVHGVDDSPGMLAHVTGLPVTRSPIESLRLRGKFDVVLLASSMLNSAPENRRAFLETLRYHLADDGVAVFQYSPPGWFAAFPDAPRERERDGITFVIHESRRTPPTMSCEVEYRVGDQAWTQAWTCYEISDAELTENLDAAGLTFGQWLTEDQAWFTARPRLH
jgi:SAM-dependent methyltransferase